MVTTFPRVEWPVSMDETSEPVSGKVHRFPIENLILVTAIAFSLFVSLPRLGAGLPMGVDSSSHLSKVMQITDSLVRYGEIPFWSPDWYGGTPFLLLYPPLSYIVTGLLGIVVGPVLAYKLVDLVFYVAAPLAVYLLAKDFGLTRLESASAALLYSTIPEVVGNYVFFDRFPTTISIVLVCLFLISLKHALHSKSVRLVIVPSLLLALIVLTHHLSGLIVVLIACIYVIATLPDLPHRIRHLAIGFGTIAGGLGLSAFWLIPYVAALGILPPNPFFNRNVTFPFLRLTYFGVDVTTPLLGIAQFIFAVLGFQILIGKMYRAKPRLQPIYLMFALLGGMASYQFGELLSSLTLTRLGTVIIVLAFVAFLGEIIQRCLGGGLVKWTGNYKFVCLWFLFFLWAGLGYYAIPLVWFYPIKTIWMSLDVDRFWLYLAIPIALLAGIGVTRAMRFASMRRKYWAILLIVLVAVPVFTGPVVKTWISDTQDVNPHLPYSAANADVPPQIIDYFRAEKSPGRILAIKCPLWVYLLPSLVNKPTIDGWYPQSKLLNQLTRIDDYRIDDLENAPSEDNRTLTWRALIDHSEILGISWLMIGGTNQTEKRLLVEGSSFGEVLVVPYENAYISIYKSIHDVKLVAASPPGQLEVTMERLSPDHIRLKLSGRGETVAIQVREAYFPTWVASADGKAIPIVKDDEGYIKLTGEAWMTTIDITQEGNQTANTIGWTMTIVTLAALAVVMMSRFRYART